MLNNVFVLCWEKDIYYFRYRQLSCEIIVVKTGVCTKRHIFLKPSDRIIQRKETQTHQIQSSCSFYPFKS